MRQKKILKTEEALQYLDESDEPEDMSNSEGDGDPSFLPSSDSESPSELTPALVVNISTEPHATVSANSEENDPAEVNLIGIISSNESLLATGSTSKRAHRKAQRVSGKEYVSPATGKFVKAKARSENPCNHEKCKKGFTDEMLNGMFASFWNLGKEAGNHDQQRQFIAGLCKQAPKKRHTVSDSSRRSNSLVYSLPSETNYFPVCKKFFLGTFGISEKFLRRCVKSEFQEPSTSIVKPDQRRKNKNSKRVTAEQLGFIHDHIKSFPAVESHYCRKSTKKLYLDANLSLRKMYDLYKEKCKEEKKVAFALETYRLQFKKFNLGFHRPKKDQCGLCLRYNQLADKSEKDVKQYEEHQERKAKARALKNEIVRKIKEEEEGFEKATFINFDLQRVLETPKGPGGPIFYKRKLACYNLTLYNMNSHAGFCNIWCETDGQRGANEVASIVFDAVSNDKDHSDFYFVSDSCGGQNRNQFFSGMCLWAVRTLHHVRSITHVYLEKEHTEQEGDSMHSAIERASRHTSINAPVEWKNICILARRNNPYTVRTLDYSFFKDFKKLTGQVVKNVKVNTCGEKVKWLDIKVLCYTVDDAAKIFYSYDYSGEYKAIDVDKVKRSVGQSGTMLSLMPAYEKKLPISDAKFKDLLSLCEQRLIHADFHAFYRNLPHGKAVKDVLQDSDIDDESDNGE